ncbi:MAG: response regulator [Desulfohalobiaceae bacterium]|nr:response regulator [Desulfohalobiaceae bacterium]
MIQNAEILNAHEAAEFLGAHVESIRRLARKGKLPAYKIGKDWRFRKGALMEWAESHHQRCSPPCVLVVDDDAGVRRVIKRILESEGYQVRLASNGTQGLECLDRESIDLIVLDLKIPEMSGPDFLDQFRKEHGVIPVVIITGYPESSLMQEAMKYGPFTLLAKPIDRNQFVQAVHLALNNSIYVSHLHHDGEL